MDESLFDITGRSLISHASQEVPKSSTPLPVIQPVSRKRSGKKRRSVLTIARPSIDPGVTPRTLIQNAHKEKNKRKSSPPALGENEVHQLRHSRSRSRKSLHDPVDSHDDVSVDENEITEERPALPDIQDISAITSQPKKQKLQLGKLDNRAYMKHKQRRPTHTIDESLLEEYDETSMNSEDSLRATSAQRRKGPNNSLSNKSKACDVNFNNGITRGSPLCEKQKPFSEKQIPHLSSDSDATVQNFSHKLGLQQKGRKSVVPNVMSNTLSDSLLLHSSRVLASPVSKRHSVKNASAAEVFPLREKDTLTHSLHVEGLNVSPYSVQRGEASKFVTLPECEESSGNSDTDEESLGEDEESLGEDEENINEENFYLPTGAGEPEERSQTAALSVHQKSTSGNLLSQNSKRVLSSMPGPSGRPQISRRDYLMKESDKDQISMSLDAIRFMEIPEPVTPPDHQRSASRASLSECAKKLTASRSRMYNIIERDSLDAFENIMNQEQQVPQISCKKTADTSGRASKLAHNASREIVTASSTPSKIPVLFSQKKLISKASPSNGSVRAASKSLPYSVVPSECLASNNTPHGSMHDHSPALAEEEEYENDSSSEDAADKLETSGSTATQQKSRSRNSVSHNAVTTSSTSYNIHMPSDIDMLGSPQVLEDASYQPHQNKISDRNVVNVSRKSGYSKKAAESEQLSPASSITSSISGKIKKKMHSTAIHDRNCTMETIERNSSPVLEGSITQTLHQANVSGKKTTNISKTSRTAKPTRLEELAKPISSTRSNASDSPTHKIKSLKSTDGSGRWETIEESSQIFDNASSQVVHQVEGSGQVPDSISKKASRTAKMLGLRQSASPFPSTRPRVSSSPGKKTAMAVAQDNSPQALHDIPQHVPHQIRTISKNPDGTSKKVRHSAKMYELEQSDTSALFMRSSISGSVKKKMHSTAIPDHNATMKTLHDDSVSVSPIRKMIWKKKSELSENQRQIVPAVHADSDSVESGSEYEQSPDRLQGKELPLPPSIQNHDDTETTGARAEPSEKKRRVKETGMPRIPAGETKRLMEHFSGMKLSRGALNTVMESCDIFWENTFETLYDYADHAGRETIEVQDVELLLYRQGYADDRNSMNALIAEYMPMEFRKEVIPIATPGNIVIP